MPGLSTPFQVSIYCWFAWEVGLLVRDLVRRKGRLGPDRGTRVIVSLTLAGSIWIGILLRSLGTSAARSLAPNASAAAGVVADLGGPGPVGLAVTGSADVQDLFIQVDVDQAVATDGPNRWAAPSLGYGRR